MIMGLLWIGVGIIFLLSPLFGGGRYVLPKIGIDLGWIVIGLGIFRLWWWWKFDELPRRRRIALRLEELRGYEEDNAADQEEQIERFMQEGDDIDQQTEPPQKETEPPQK